MLHFIYFFPTNISTEYFKHAVHSSFFSSKCRLFHNSTFFGSCIIHILHTGFAKKSVFGKVLEVVFKHVHDCLSLFGLFVSLNISADNKK